MFQLCQRVCSKKTGLPMTGTIAGIWHPQAYLNHLAFKGVDLTSLQKSWSRFPGWEKKLLYYVYFDTPGKTCSREEWEQFNIHMPYESLPTEIIALYPEDDLELME